MKLSLLFSSIRFFLYLPSHICGQPELVPELDTDPQVEWEYKHHWFLFIWNIVYETIQFVINREEHFILKNQKTKVGLC